MTRAADMLLPGEVAAQRPGVLPHVESDAHEALLKARRTDPLAHSGAEFATTMGVPAAQLTAASPDYFDVLTVFSWETVRLIAEQVRVPVWKTSPVLRRLVLTGLRRAVADSELDQLAHAAMEHYEQAVAARGGEALRDHLLVRIRHPDVRALIVALGGEVPPLS